MLPSHWYIICFSASMEIHYETPGSISEALEMLADKRAIFVDREDALIIIMQCPKDSFRLHWNSPVQGRVAIIPHKG